MKSFLTALISLLFIWMITGCTLDRTSKDEMPLCIKGSEIAINSILSDAAIAEMEKDTSARCGFAPYVQDYRGTISFTDENSEMLNCDLLKSYHLRNDLLKHVSISSRIENSDYWTADRLKKFGEDNLTCNIATNSDSSYWVWENKDRYEYLGVYQYNDTTVTFIYRTNAR